MAKLNPFDQIIDNLLNSLKKVENFHLLGESGHGDKFHNLTIVRAAEIREFKNMFVSYFIPKANEMYVLTKNSYAKSKYKGLISLTEDQLKENVYETIRLGYVGMFHKYEAFVTELIECAELVIADEEKPKTSLEDFVFRKFGHHLSKEKGKYDKPIVQKLNWISNSIKHCDGKPYPKYKPVEYQNYPENKRLTLTKDDFKRDCDMLIDHYLTKMKIVFNVALYKSIFENENENDSPELIENKLHLEGLLSSLLKPSF